MASRDSIAKIEREPMITFLHCYQRNATTINDGYDVACIAMLLAYPNITLQADNPWPCAQHLYATAWLSLCAQLTDSWTKKVRLKLTDFHYRSFLNFPKRVVDRSLFLFKTTVLAKKIENASNWNTKSQNSKTILETILRILFLIPVWKKDGFA